MSKNKVIIYGVGKFAEYVRYIFDNDSDLEVCAYCIESKYKKEEISIEDDIPLLNFDNIEESYSINDYKMIIAVGDNNIRERLFKEAKIKGYEMASYLSTKAVYWDNLNYGENVIITEDTGIQPFVSIGNNCIIIGAKIGHHSKIGNNVLMSCTFIAGNVEIGDNSFLGLNSSFKQNIKLGKHNIIGMNSLITHDTNDFEFYTGPKAVKRTITSKKINYLK